MKTNLEISDELYDQGLICLQCSVYHSVLLVHGKVVLSVSDLHVLLNEMLPISEHIQLNICNNRILNSDFKSVASEK